AALLEASAPRGLRSATSRHRLARLIDEIARTGIGAVDGIIGLVGHEAALIAHARAGDAACSGVDGMRRAILPAGKIVPAELRDGRVPQRVVGRIDVRSAQVELAEEATLVAAL